MDTQLFFTYSTYKSSECYVTAYLKSQSLLLLTYIQTYIHTLRPLRVRYLIVAGRYLHSQVTGQDEIVEVRVRRYPRMRAYQHTYAQQHTDFNG